MLFVTPLVGSETQKEISPIGHTWQNCMTVLRIAAFLTLSGFPITHATGGLTNSGANLGVP